jgi:hypothetical protein
MPESASIENWVLSRHHTAQVDSAVQFNEAPRFNIKASEIRRLIERGTVPAVNGDR